MNSSILSERRGTAMVITLNRPDMLNAWDRPMRDRLVALLDEAEHDEAVRTVILTGAGDRAFCAGQDLNEARTFDAARAEEWIEEWVRLYGRLRSLSKPTIIALNGLAAGSAFQVALLADFRIGHPGVKMGQPEINSGIPSIVGPCLMREALGIARTTDLSLTGRMMDAEECRSLGLLNRVVPADQVLEESLRLAEELAKKAPIALRMTKARLREMTEPALADAFQAAKRYESEAFGTGEPARKMEEFFAERARRN